MTTIIWGMSDPRILEDKESESLLWFLAKIAAAGLESEATLSLLEQKMCVSCKPEMSHALRPVWNLLGSWPMKLLMYRSRDPSSKQAEDMKLSRGFWRVYKLLSEIGI